MSNENFNIFWGSPDSWIQERFNYTYNELELELKLLALLFDKIILSPAFLLESQKIDTLLRNNIALVENGVVSFSFSNMSLLPENKYVLFSEIRNASKMENKDA
jgi:murein tripeptide amidase MpaA